MPTSLAALLVVFVAGSAFAADKSASKDQPDPAFEKDKAALIAVIEEQAAAFWAKDFDRWEKTWVHAPYIGRRGWYPRGGVVAVDGWDEIGERMRKSMQENPKPNATPTQVVRDHFTFRIYRDSALVTFQQHAPDTGDVKFDMAGLSHETRFFEKQDGKWKVVYLGYLLAGGPPAGSGQVQPTPPGAHSGSAAPPNRAP